MTALDLLELVTAAIRDSQTVLVDPPPGKLCRSVEFTPPEYQARAVLAAISEAGTVEWGVLLGDLKQPHACKSEADARRDSECACCTLATRITGPWTAVEG